MKCLKNCSLQVYPKWISVKDKIPEDDEECLVAFECIPNYAYELATYCDIGKKFEFWSGKKAEVTHWMPLPHPPKDE